MTTSSLPALLFSPSHATPSDPRDGLLHHTRYGWTVWSEGEWCVLGELPEDAVRLIPEPAADYHIVNGEPR